MQANVNKECICSLMDKQIINAGAGSYTLSKDWYCPVHGTQHRVFKKPEMFKSQEERGCEDCQSEKPIPHAHSNLPPKSEAQGESWEVEKLSATLHDIYQKEAHRQEDAGIGKARHYDEYEKLSEPVKEFDRVLARFIIEKLEEAREKAKDEYMLADTLELETEARKQGKLAAYQEVREIIVRKTREALSIAHLGYNEALSDVDAWAVEKLAANDTTV